MSQIRLTVDIDESGDLVASLIVDQPGDLSERDVQSLALAGLFGAMESQMHDSLQEVDPLLNGDILDSLASLNARIALMDLVVHLPATTARGIVTSY